MLQEFKRIPEPLRKQVLIRLGLGALFFILLIALLATFRDIYLWLPCAGAAVFFAAAAFLVFRRAVLGDYVIIRGVCAEVSLTPVKRRVKYFILRADARDIKVILSGRQRKIKTGMTVSLYAAKNAPIYEGSGLRTLHSYIALEARHARNGG